MVLLRRCHHIGFSTSSIATHNEILNFVEKWNFKPCYIHDIRPELPCGYKSYYDSTLSCSILLRILVNAWWILSYSKHSTQKLNPGLKIFEYDELREVMPPSSVGTQFQIIKDIGNGHREMSCWIIPWLHHCKRSNVKVTIHYLYLSTITISYQLHLLFRSASLSKHEYWHLKSLEMAQPGYPAQGYPAPAPGGYPPPAPGYGYYPPPPIDPSVPIHHRREDTMSAATWPAAICACFCNPVLGCIPLFLACE